MKAARHRMGAVEGWTVTHDGETVKTGFASDGEAMKWIHDRRSFSVDHAVEHEGYDIVLVKDGKAAWSFKRDVVRKRRQSMSPVEYATAFEQAVRAAFVEVYGPPRDAAVIERSILSSYLERGQKLGWTRPDPHVVLVLTEFAWVSEPFTSTEDMANWEMIANLLHARGWPKPWFDSINAAVQVVYSDPKAF